MAGVNVISSCLDSTLALKWPVVIFRVPIAMAWDSGTSGACLHLQKTQGGALTRKTEDQ